MLPAARTLGRLSRRRRAGLALAAVAALVAVGSLSGAQAAPTVHHLGSGGGPIRKSHGGTDSAVLVDGTNVVRKARTAVKLHRFMLRAYANETFTLGNHLLLSSTPGWVVTRHGKHPTFGVFPVTHTAVLGFGAIPITADLHLSQVVRDGRITPIVIHTKASTQPPFKVYPTIVTGLIDIRLSNVRVDEVPVHVGADCHTATPVQLRLVGIAPGYDLFTGGPLKGPQTVPPFTGCGTGGDDLDPLITGTISGPDNPLAMMQGNLAQWDTSQPSDCSGCLPPKSR